MKFHNERESVFAAYQRERVSRHLDGLFEAASEILAISDLAARRTWMESEDRGETQERLLAHVSDARLQAITLSSFGAIESDLSGQVQMSLDAVPAAWDAAIGELAKKEPAFRDAVPDAPPYDGGRYVDLAGTLYTRALSLVDLVGTVPRSVVIPK